jgi:four helix bundle protein
MKIAAKEADETQYWLLLCEKSKKYPNPSLYLSQTIESIVKILSKIIATTKTS